MNGAPAPSPPRTALLVVDDEPAIRALVAEALEDLPVEMAGTGDVAEALTLAASRRFDLVLSDLCLGNDSGWRVLDGVRRPDGGPAVVMMSGAWDGPSRQHARARGVEAWDKPLDIVVLRRWVTQAGPAPDMASGRRASSPPGDRELA